MGWVDQMSYCSTATRRQDDEAETQPGDDAQRLRHDLRQSLSLVMLLAAVVDQQPLDGPDIRTSVDQIANEVGHMAQVLSGGAAEPGPETVDVGEIVACIWSTVARSQQCHLRLVRESAAFVSVDPLELGRSVRNLVDNAVRAAGDGVVDVRVVTTDDDVVVEVGDSGPGFGLIPPQQCLGLVTVRRFAATSGGRLEIDTSALGGALLRLVIPQASVLPDVAQQAPASARTTA